MTASPSQLISAIEPGSTDYGDRQTLEAGLAASSPDGAPAPDPAAAAVAPPVDAGGDPLSALLSGAVNPGGSGPLTSGLSVGPGAGPMGQLGQVDPKEERLRQVATQSQSPVVRALARNELRRLTAGRV